MTAGGGWEKVLQVWWARRAHTTGNVAALSALRRGARGAGAGSWGLGVTPASCVREGSWTLRTASGQWEPHAAKRVGGRALALSSLLGAKDVG